MNIRVWHVFVLFVILILIGCGYREGVIQTAPKSYLWFTGNTNNAVVYIDDNKPFNLSLYERDINTGESKARTDLIHYQLAPGKHNIIVKREDKVVVNRMLILGEGMTTEIEIP